jgi:hypothetical protein
VFEKKETSAGVWELTISGKEMDGKRGEGREG